MKQSTMKQSKFLLALVLILASSISYAQVGIGTTAPTMKLHIADADSQILLLENTEALNIGTETAIYFKTGEGSFPYTGAIKTIGTGTTLARLSLFTYAASSPGGLLERMSILDNGNVGIGISSPFEKLEVAGNVKVDGTISGVSDPIADNDAANKKYVDDEISSLPLVITYSVGDFTQGGIVFWLDATGQHGLIAATADQTAGIGWYNGAYTVTNAVRDGVGAGKFNTERIIANQGAGNYAAQICANYQGGNYGDWYLPSKYELNLLYLQKTAVGSFAFAFYWSSTENDNNKSWAQSFDNGNQNDYSKFIEFKVRAVRAF
jgi:hypothetical protein